ncbi:unnamed protein product [Cuscuta epithymum]|uniref:Uncharacterized protein n=1 Tax=Cuscuta epithymum TaxID=186058 RepID=A0AAV0GF66_9ASTE|nr:unnamed protein product [Cuscuta epithymum]
MGRGSIRARRILANFNCSTGEMIGIWRLFAFGLAVLVRYFGQEMEGSTTFDIVSGGRIYLSINSCIKPVWWLAIRFAPLGMIVSMSNRRANSSNWKVKVFVSSGWSF